MPSITLQINDKAYPVFTFESVAAVNTISLYQTTLISHMLDMPMVELMDPARINITQDKQVSYYWGVVTALEQYYEHGHLLVSLTIEPRLQLLSYEAIPRVLSEQSIIDVTAQCLTSIGYTATQQQYRLMRNYLNRTYMAQMPQQTTLDFLYRLWSEQGLHYFFQGDADYETLCLLDNNQLYQRSKQHAVPIITDTGLTPHRAYGLYQVQLQYHMLANLSMSYYLTAKSDYLHFQIGEVIEVDAASLHDKYSGLYIVSKLQSTAKQIDSAMVDYQVSIKLVPMTQVAFPLRYIPKQMVTVFRGRILSDNEYGYMDEQGYNRVQPLFHQGLSGPASKPVPRIHSYGLGGMREQGECFPLRQNSEVLLSILENNIDEPVILGALANCSYPSPVVQSNAQQNIIRTLAESYLLFDDTPSHQRICFSLDNGNQLLFDTQQHCVLLESQVGDLSMYAQHDLIFCCQQSHRVHVAGTVEYQVKQAYSCITYNGNLSMNAVNVLIRAKQALAFTAQGDFTASSDENIAFTSNAGITIAAKQGEICYQAKQGAISIVAADDIRIDAVNMLELAQQTAILSMRDGSIRLHGQAIQLNSQRGVMLKGQVYFESTSDNYLA